MDHQGRRSRPLIGVFVAIGCVFGAARAAEGPLRAMRWMAPGANHLRTLGERPAECLKRPETRDVAYSVEIGRAAFRTPLLLGGQAARAGVACETCHEGGHTNPEFLFPGVSGAPGTPGNRNSGLVWPPSWQVSQATPARAACPPSSSGVRKAARPTSTE